MTTQTAQTVGPLATGLAVDLADAITKRLSDMTDAEFAALEARMITQYPLRSRSSTQMSRTICRFEL